MWKSHGIRVDGGMSNHTPGPRRRTERKNMERKEMMMGEKVIKLDLEHIIPENAVLRITFEVGAVSKIRVKIASVLMAVAGMVLGVPVVGTDINLTTTPPEEGS